MLCERGPGPQETGTYIPSRKLGLLTVTMPLANVVLMARDEGRSADYER
jgi:hypothetical protein